MQTNASKHIWTCLSPQEDMWHLSSWTPSIWDPWEILSTSILSPWRSLSLPEGSLSPWEGDTLSKMISFDVISLSPFDVNFQEGLDKNVISLFLWNLSWMGLILESQHKALDKNVMLVRGQDSLSGAGSEETQNMWQTVFPVMKSLAPSGMLRLYRKDSVGPKTTNRWNRVHRRENTCHLSSLD